MAELRQDPITREWVNIAPERDRRSSDFARTRRTISRRKGLRTTCPFCPGQEDTSSADLLRYPRAEAGDWSVRVVPNKFPAFFGEAKAQRRHHGTYQVAAPTGAHEVVIETSRHDTKLADLSEAEVMMVLRAYRARYLALRADKRLKYVLIFGNHGEAAGASIQHAHSQIIATPMIPQYARTKIEGVERYERKYGRCVYCDMVEQELNEEERLVAVNNSFVAFAPYASRHPFEAWIVPIERRAHFVDVDDSVLSDLARIFKEVLLRLDLCLNDPPYNFMLLTTELSERFHWHIEIVPRLAVAAGFELGAGVYINSTAPETAAAQLREVLPPSKRLSETHESLCVFTT